LSNKRRVTLTEFKGKSLVSIREYYMKDGKELPSSKGISLTAEQWSNFSKNVPAIEKAIKKMEAKFTSCNATTLVESWTFSQAPLQPHQILSQAPIHSTHFSSCSGLFHPQPVEKDSIIYLQRVAHGGLMATTMDLF
nr:RNA polymerase II transcriptional coactivator KELP [Tanacetum cinerariifolium]